MPDVPVSPSRRSGPRSTRADRTIETRTCQDCGMLLDHPAEFHPYVFCVLKKAGRDPWEDFANVHELFTGNSLPGKPPLIRDLPWKSGSC